MLCSILPRMMTCGNDYCGVFRSFVVSQMFCFGVCHWLATWRVKTTYLSPDPPSDTTNSSRKTNLKLNISPTSSSCVPDQPNKQNNFNLIIIAKIYHSNITNQNASVSTSTKQKTFNYNIRVLRDTTMNIIIPIIYSSILRHQAHFDYRSQLLQL